MPQKTNLELVNSKLGLTNNDWVSQGRIDKIPAKHRKVVETQLRKISISIQNRRVEMGLTQEELAEILDLTVVALDYIEQGRRYPSLPFLFYICRVMDIPIKIGA